MDFISESRVVYVLVTGCVVMSQIYFLTKYRAAGKVYLVRSSQRSIELEDIEGEKVTDGMRRRRDRKATYYKSHDETLIKHSSSLPDLDRLLKLVYGASVLANFYLTLKYLILCVLDSQTMREYRYIDCLLIGRASINGRTTGLAKYVGLCFPWFQLAWRFTMLYLRPEFNFVFMEFLLQNPNELIVWEAETQRRSRLTNSSRSVNPTLPAADKPSAKKANPDLSDELDVYSDKRGESDHKYSTLMNYKNPFAAEGRLVGASENFSRLRPNRTFRAWSRTSQILLVYLLVSFICALLALAPILRMALPLVLTRPGFRLNYYNCIDWISRRPNKQQYAFIDTANKNDTEAALALASTFMPLGDLVEFNLYHSLRILVDILENLLIYVEALMSFVIYTSVAIVSAADMFFYTEHINRRVEQMIQTLKPDSRLEEQGHKKQQKVNNPTYAAFLGDGKGAELGLIESSSKHVHELDMDHDDYRTQKLDIQAMIVDMFALIEAYNPYAAYFTSFSLTIWFVYSAVCTGPWLFLPTLAETSTFEWYLLEALATFFIFIIIGAFNIVRRSTSKLYRSLCTLALLDHTRSSGRNDRWLGLLKLYTPIPLHCFTTFSTSEISWLLGMKMLAWLASALFVASSFLVRAVNRVE